MPAVNPSTFAVFLSLNPTNIDPPRYLMLMRRLLQQGPGTGITVLDDAIFLLSREFCALLVVSADSRQRVEDALEGCKDVFVAQIAEAAEVRLDPGVQRTGYCLMQRPKAEGGMGPAPRPNADPLSVSVRTQLELAGVSPCTRLWLVEAPTWGQAMRFAQSAAPGQYIECLAAMSVRDYFNFRYEAPGAAGAEFGGAAPVGVAPQPAASDFFIMNEDSSQAYYSDYQQPDGQPPNFYQLFQNRKRFRLTRRCRFSSTLMYGKPTPVPSLIRGTTSGSHAPAKY
jgi:hypothetical protein